MTQITQTDAINRLGVKHVREVIEQGWGCVIQEIEGRNDRGFDGTFFDFHAGRTTSLRFDIQIKSSKAGFSEEGGSLAPSVDAKHRDLYVNSPVPVVIICVDVRPPVTAFWQVVEPGKALDRIHISKRNIFGPASRDVVLSAIQRAFPRQIDPAKGELLELPLGIPLRHAAKNYYQRKLMRQPQSNPAFGPVEFTWKGWRHITRLRRSKWKIRSSLLLLPSVRAVLSGPILPIHSRPLKTVCRGGRIQFRTLLAFEREVVFFGRGRRWNRAPAWVRVVIESQATLPKDWAMSLPNDPRRRLSYKFLSLCELPKRAEASQLN